MIGNLPRIIENFPKIEFHKIDHIKVKGCTHTKLSDIK
jgi:hypothetical protein